MVMWHSAHHGGNECFDPGRERLGGWGQGHEPHHNVGWGDHCVSDPGWRGGCDDDPGWINGCDPHGDRGGWGGGDCHDGGHGLISLDHNSILVCH